MCNLNPQLQSFCAHNLFEISINHYPEWIGDYALTTWVYIPYKINF